MKNASVSFDTKMSPLLMFICFGIALADDLCARPPDLLTIEGKCCEDYEAKESFLEKVYEKSKSFFDMAKKKLGMEVEEEPKKCYYYECIFQHLEFMDDSNLPDLSRMQTWIENVIEEDYKTETLDHTIKCFDDLKNNFGYERTKRNTQDEIINALSGCEIALNLTQCLSKQTKCSIFHYP